LRNLIVVSVVGVIGAALLVAGCGGGGEDGADAQQIDKAAFVKQADAICEQASGRMAAELQSFTQREAARNSNETQILLLRKVLVPGLEEEQRQIKALGIPKEAKKEAEALLEAYRKAIDRTKTRAKAILENAAKVVGSPEPQEAVALAARRIGIARCPIAPVTGN
jgi:hypothetical protein